jgi:hypothetical protein
MVIAETIKMKFTDRACRAMQFKECLAFFLIEILERGQPILTKGTILLVNKPFQPFNSLYERVHHQSQTGISSMLLLFPLLSSSHERSPVAK